jgi:hypothetical protein
MSVILMFDIEILFVYDHFLERIKNAKNNQSFKLESKTVYLFASPIE